MTEPPAPGRLARWRALVRRPAVLFGLAGVAITQPLLDLLGNNPEFFVAGDYSPSQIVAFGLVVAIVPALVAVALVTVGSVIHLRAGAVVHSVAVGVFAGLFGLALLRELGADRLLVSGAGALAVAGAVVVLELRSKVARLFLSYLAIANALFLVSFTAMSPTSELVLDRGGDVDVGEVAVPQLEGPVVVVILDEFPLPSLLRPDGSINDARFPNFARLAKEATWFRNASSRHSVTHRAVPAALTGRTPSDDDLPTYHDHPRNLLSLLGTRYPVYRYESVTDLCPPNTCDPPPRQSLGQAISDGAVVYGHRVLPARFRSHLPEIDRAWGNFGDDLGDDAQEPASTTTTTTTIPGPTTTLDPKQLFLDKAFTRWNNIAAKERSALGQALVLRERASRIDRTPALHLIHVALPHHPFTLGPGGFKLSTYPKPLPPPDDPAYGFYMRLLYQLHERQIGATDEAIGDVVAHLKKIDAWDDTTLVVMSDHGHGLTPPDLDRNVTERSRNEVLRVPLFIKAAGQRSGEVRDDVALTIDVLPSLVDLLDIECDWKFEGHSLFDGSKRTVDPVVETDVRKGFEVAARHAADFPEGDDWLALASVGAAQGLVGRSVDDVEVGAPSRLQMVLGQRALLDNLPAEGNQLLVMPAGRIVATTARPPELVVAVNRTIAGVVGGYTRVDGGWKFVGYVANFFRTGANTLVAYEVERVGARIVLHEVREAVV